MHDAAPSVAVARRAPALVIGAGGLIGGELLRQLLTLGWQAVGTARNPPTDSSLIRYDLAAPTESLLSSPAVRKLRSEGSWIAFLVAGVSGYERCARDPAGTRRVNVTNSMALAAQVRQAGGFVVYPSSSSVFGQESEPRGESSPPSPNSEYGRQKADAEQALLSLIPPDPGGAAIVRLTKVLAAQGLIGRWLNALRTGSAVEAATNLRLTPISLPFTARGLIEIAASGRAGVYHLAGECTLTYFELAQRLAAAMGADTARVKPVEVELPESFGTTGDAVLTMSETSRCTGLTPQTVASVIRDLVGAAEPWAKVSR